MCAHNVRARDMFDVVCRAPCHEHHTPCPPRTPRQAHQCVWMCMCVCACEGGEGGTHTHIHTHLTRPRCWPRASACQPRATSAPSPGPLRQLPRPPPKVPRGGEGAVREGGPAGREAVQGRSRDRRVRAPRSKRAKCACMVSTLVAVGSVDVSRVRNARVWVCVITVVALCAQHTRGSSVDAPHPLPPRSMMGMRGRGPRPTVRPLVQLQPGLVPPAPVGPARGPRRAPGGPVEAVLSPRALERKGMPPYR